MSEISIQRIKKASSKKHGKDFVIYNINNSFILSLSENGKFRKIFRGQIHQADDETRLEGQIVCQRKGKNEKWEDIEKIFLNKMNAGEEKTISLKSIEISGLACLFDEIHKINSDVLKTGKIKLVNSDDNIDINNKNKKQIIEKLL